MKNELLLPYLFNRAYKNNTPLIVIIELLTKCNLKCTHCYLPEHTDPGLHFETVKKLLFNLRNMGVLNVSFTGGEIFLRDDLYDLIKITRDLYMRVFLLSNGTKEIDAERLSKLHIAEFSTTIFSMDNKVHDSITQVNGSLESLLNNLNNLKLHNIRIRVKMPLMKNNLYCIDDVIKFCNDNKFEFTTSPTIFSKNDGDKSPEKLRIEKDDLKYAINKIDKLNNQDASQIHSFDVPCAALFCGFSIDCKGDVYPCNSLLYKVGNIYQNDIQDIWNYSDELKYIKSLKKSDLTKCRECEYESICERCPGMALLDNNDVLTCDQYAKLVAEIIFNRK